MARWGTAVRLVGTGHVHPGTCPICGPTAFAVTGDWLRDQYLCLRCKSIPRQRLLTKILNRLVPDWPDRTIVESSPSGPASALIARRCANYLPSQYLEGVPVGTVSGGHRCEDLRRLTYDDASVDVVITQDVLEHVVGPAPAFQEIARILRPGGLHVFTVPIFARPETLVRVADDGTQLLEPDYHDNPVGDGRSLVAREWGDDIVGYILEASGLRTTRYDETSWRHGIRGRMKDVLVSSKLA